jgi:hypothetical protein
LTDVGCRQQFTMSSPRTYVALYQHVATFTGLHYTYVSIRRDYLLALCSNTNQHPAVAPQMVSSAMLRPSLCALTGPASRHSGQRLAGSLRAFQRDFASFHGARRYHMRPSSATTSSSHSGAAPRGTTAAMLGLVRPVTLYGCRHRTDIPRA